MMRCLSIADGFRKAGKDCLFVTADDELQGIIKYRGYENTVLNSKFDCMDSELEAFEAVIDTKKTDIVFVDSYYVTERYLKDLWRFCAEKHSILVYIDDIFAFPYFCDVVLNYSIYVSEDNYISLYQHNILPDLLLGTQYIPLRSEFQNLSDRKVKKKGKDILISTGGADVEHMGVELVKTIARHDDWKNFIFHFIVGSLNNDKDEINSLARNRENIKLYENVKRMSELMRTCDVAVSAAGSTLYELCATQTPSVSYILADNQLPGAKGLEEKEILDCAGDYRDIGLNGLAERVLTMAVELADNYKQRYMSAIKMKAIVDGKGAERIVQALLQKK